MKISDFLNKELVDYASYDNLRSIASYVDGQKNTSRKILYTILKKNINTELKVSQLSNKMAELTQYLHGDASGVVVGMGQHYVGTNNVPLIAAEGNFGTRFKPEASAPRYIYTMKNKNTERLFKKEDEAVLISQQFEGDEIEPRFYIPTLPILLLNGSMNCITPGFAQHILPRKESEVIEYIKCKLKGEDTSHLTLFPYFEGYTGDIVQGETFSKWEIRGKVEKVGNAGVRVTELPMNWDLKKYEKFLDELVDKKVIRSFKDRSENDKFTFEIMADKAFLELSELKMLEKLKLIKKEAEQYSCITEHNKIRQFNKVTDILDAFIKLKKEYLQKRKDYQLEKLKDDMNFEASKYLFIKHINDGDIIINKQTKQQIIDQLEPYDRIITKDGSYDYLLSISIYRLTVEEMDKAKDNIMKMKESYKNLSSSTVEDIWLSEV